MNLCRPALMDARRFSIIPANQPRFCLDSGDHRLLDDVSPANCILIDDGSFGLLSLDIVLSLRCDSRRPLACRSSTCRWQVDYDIGAFVPVDRNSHALPRKTTMGIATSQNSRFTMMIAGKTGSRISDVFNEA